MTRGMFFRMLAVMGFGQATVTLDPSKMKDGECLRWTEKAELVTVPCKAGCKKGEERCPLGHCQKPQAVDVIVDAPRITLQTLQIEDARVCSICGIVYVPKGAPQ
jgi:hypothetical protein